MSFRIPSHNRPDVSVIIPLYGGKQHLGRCITSLLENTEGSFELIAVDNASPDGSGDWISKNVEGAVVIRNSQNLGFSAACNQGAEIANSGHICFLNADAFCESGWLQPLLEDLQMLPRVGAVVPMFCNVDGTLQQAGTLVDQTGQAIFFGATDDPARLRFRFRRTVDYGSGACLVVSRNLFLSAGGFDLDYSPAFYEDVDFGFRLQRAGLFTIYEPRSRITHVWGGSTPPEIVEELRKKHNETFMRRFSNEIEARPRWSEEAQPHTKIACRDAVMPYRLLIVAREVPQPSDDVGEILQTLTDKWPLARIALLTRVPPDLSPNTEHWLARGVEMSEEPGGPAVWLRHRILHFSNVIITNEEGFSSEVQRTQPHIEPLRWPALPSDYREQLLGAGWSPN